MGPRRRPSFRATTARNRARPPWGRCAASSWNTWPGPEHPGRRRSGRGALRGRSRGSGTAVKPARWPRTDRPSRAQDLHLVHAEDVASGQPVDPHRHLHVPVAEVVGMDDDAPRFDRQDVLKLIPGQNLDRSSHQGVRRHDAERTMGHATRPPSVGRRLRIIRGGHGRGADGDSRRAAPHRPSRRHPRAPNDGRGTQCPVRRHPDGVALSRKTGRASRCTVSLRTSVR